MGYVGQQRCMRRAVGCTWAAVFRTDGAQVGEGVRSGLGGRVIYGAQVGQRGYVRGVLPVGCGLGRGVYANGEERGRAGCKAALWPRPSISWIQRQRWSELWRKSAG